MGKNELWYVSFPRYNKLLIAIVIPILFVITLMVVDDFTSVFYGVVFFFGGVANLILFVGLLFLKSQTTKNVDFPYMTSRAVLSFLVCSVGLIIALVLTGQVGPLLFAALGMVITAFGAVTLAIFEAHPGNQRS